MMFEGRLAKPADAVIGDDLVQLVLLGGFPGAISRDKTGQRYVGLLEQVFLIAIVQPWFTNALKRMVKTPKLHFLDSGLLATARGLTFDRVKGDRTTFGSLLESFVFSEILKLMTATDLRLSPYHFRDRDGREGQYLGRHAAFGAANGLALSSPLRPGRAGEP